MKSADSVSSSPHRLHKHQYASIPYNQQRQPHHHHNQRQQQQECDATTPVTRQRHARHAPTSSSSRQERFRKTQKEYYQQSPIITAAPTTIGIGLDYVRQELHHHHHQHQHRSQSAAVGPSPLVLDPNARTPLPRKQPSSEEKRSSGVVNRMLQGMGVSGKPATVTITTSTERHAIDTSPFSSQPQYDHHHNEYQQQQLSAAATVATTTLVMPPTATEWARRAPHAGFLQKMGTNVPTYKRRFFVLQPTTQLYYFLSPHDTIPRGSIAIDEARVEFDNNNKINRNNNNDDNSGETKFALHWPDGSSLHLEARTPEAAQTWCQSFKQERLSFVRAQLAEEQDANAQLRAERIELERQLDHYRFVEQDRDGALEDARRWKQQFEALDESLRLLANHVRKVPMTTTMTTEGEPQIANDTDQQGTNIDQKEVTAERKETEDANSEADIESDLISRASNREEAKEKASTEDNEKTQSEARKHETTSLTVPNTSDDEMIADEKKAEPIVDDQDNANNISRDISLLDDDAAAEEAAALLFEKNNILEDLNAPGQHFSSLVNACQQLRENLKLASEEASTAVEDTKQAQLRAETLQKRMTKAEKQLCQLWEENCTIRKTLKQKKRERRVLVREIKSLMEQQQANQQQQAEREAELQQRQVKRKSSNGASSKPVSREGAKDTLTAWNEEERIASDLKEHALARMRLNEEFLSPGRARKGEDQKLSCNSTVTTAASSKSGSGNPSTIGSTTSSALTSKAANQKSHSAHPAVLSLFDGSSSDSDSGGEDKEKTSRSQFGLAAAHSATAQSGREDTGRQEPVHDVVDARSISSVAASFGGDSRSSRSVGRSHCSSPLPPNPILLLDQEEKEDEEQDEALRFRPINVAQSGNATSRLVCPLADVVRTRSNVVLHNDRSPHGEPKSPKEDLQIYHVTFYTRKIGLQFQKVPVPPAKSRGLLTDAMTADLAGNSKNGCGTTAELRRVAAISNGANTPYEDALHDGNYLQPATPVDAVLVCGFEGFDDSGNNIRPKLGARLVAFDGVSVEVGRWTFDSIRKAIHARGRPLTLSFRNDFLTQDQRNIMTKVVSEMEKSQPMVTPASVVSQMHSSSASLEHDRVPSTVPSLGSAPSHETAQFVNETLKTSNAIHLPSSGFQKRLDYDDDELTVSTTGYSDYHNTPHQFQYSEPQQRFTASSTGSDGSGRPAGGGGGLSSHRSFSEAGSSTSALSSAIGPLMANLMSSISAEKKRVNMTPDYLIRKRTSVEEALAHQDFQSNLL